MENQKSAPDAAEPPRLFILSGNTMGSFDPLAEIRYLAQCMKPEDRLIVDGEIHDAQGNLLARGRGRFVVVAQPVAV